MKCGGSDGLSGITANPLIGRISDIMVANGGKTVLSEVPEMFGAETILMDRCETRELFDKTVDLINNFKEYFLSHGQPVGENPSPGNKKGGITTLEDKSLGCTQKGGTSDVKGVLLYGEKATAPGLSLLQGPGNDIVAISGMMASGCHIILFSTGRGTPVGSPVPTVKIATNSELANRKPNWIDWNAGRLIEDKEMDSYAEEFFKYIPVSYTHLELVAVITAAIAASMNTSADTLVVRRIRRVGSWNKEAIEEQQNSIYY